VLDLLLRSMLVVSMAAVMPAIAAASGPARPSATAATQSVAEELLIDADNHSLGARARTWLREKMVCDEDLTCYGLKLDDGWQQSPADEPIVVVVHGFNSTPAKNQAMVAAIRAAGHPCGTFAYPNDYTIAASAQLLSCELRRLAREHPERRVALVCHSMGGMVARACVEDGLYDPGNVDRLIMIAPPSRGSCIAYFAVGTDLWEHWLARRTGSPWRRFHDSVVDGLGEAADELRPGSEFLDELNSRPRNPRVEYSIILGTGARMSEAEMQWIRQSVVSKLADVPGAEQGAERLDALLADMDELVAGKGDGVVAVKRGRLDGVNDTLVIPFGHLSVTGAATTDAVRQVQQAVLERLN
jgi:pimeloyl-ACP methyl ester carboxylesterase